MPTDQIQIGFGTIRNFNSPPNLNNRKKCNDRGKEGKKRDKEE